MNKLLNELITTPTVFGIIVVALFFVCFTFAVLTDVYNNKHPYRKNPYIIPMFATLIMLLTVSVGTLVRQNMIESNPLHYVKVQKTDKNLIITSNTMFLKSANLNIKEDINNGVIVEHEGNEYVVRNDQLQ